MCNCNSNIDLIVNTEDNRYLPSYANETDACMDLKARIDATGPSDTIVIKPGQSVKIPTGLRVKIPENYVMLMFVRSSTGIKKNLCLANGTGIIDAGYRDEIIMCLHNFGDKDAIITNGDRICQFMIIPRPKVNLINATSDKEFLAGDRGGGIGSTGDR